jgi:hypothetical protein
LKRDDNWWGVVVIRDIEIETEPFCGETYILDGTPETDVQLSLVTVSDAQPTILDGVNLDSVVVDHELPGLGVVTRRCENRIPEQKPETLGK